MYWFVLVVPIVVLGVLAIFRQLWLGKNNASNDYGWGGFGFACLAISAIVLIGGALYNLLGYSDQIEQGEELAQVQAQEAIYKDKADTLTKQFAGYLAEIYPQHEKDIFNKLKPEGVSIYMAKYPDLKASATIVKLAEEIGKLQNDYYGQQLLRAKILKEMRYRVKNPWVVQRFMPSVQVPAN